MAMNRLLRRSFQFEDRQMEGYVAAYHAYLAQRNLPGPEPTFADFIEIRRLQEEMGSSPYPASNNG